MNGGPEAPTLSDGRYTLTRRLGEGGMASVFLAWDNKLKVWRAVKVLLPSVLKKKKVRKRFENEAHAMARLEHPNIVRVYDVGSENNVPYMVMELAEGGCIIDWLSRYGPMPPRLAVDVTVQICKGIRAAHEAGIVHRDIKPHNVLVNGKGTCKVTDFGIAQVMDIDTLTKTGSVMGTWGYMAPEQRTDAKAVDERADVFSIGATLYTLLTHRTPTELYVADEDDEVFEGIPPELLEVIVAACRYKPGARFPDVKSLGMAVYKAGTTQPLVPPSTPSLVLSNDPLPDSVETAPLSPTIVQDLNQALGRGLDTTAPDEDEPGAGPAAAPPVERPRQTEPSKVLPYYMPSSRTGPSPAPRGPGVPSYLDPVEAEREQRAQRRAATPPPVQTYESQPAAQDDSAPEGSAVDMLIKLSVVPLVLFVAMLGVLGWGTTSVNAAARNAQDRASALSSHLRQPGPLVDALVVAGADRAPLEEAYMAFADAKGADRAPAAVAFVDVLEQAAASVEAPPSAMNELAALEESRDAYHRANDDWAATANGLVGGLAVSAGLTRAP
ncbi:MAG: serine/threonine-protein kinase [Myxococcota bacterium]